MQEVEQLAAWAEAGLYDPDAPDAAHRLALLLYLAGLGADIDELVAAQDDFSGLAFELALRPGRERLSLTTAAERAGVDVTTARHIWRAAGFPDPDPDARRFTDADSELFAVFRAATTLFGEVGALQLARVVGTAVARIAEAGISAFVVTLDSPREVDGPDELALAEANVQAAGIVPGVGRLMELLLRHHLAAARRPLLTAAGPPGGVEVMPLTVGFADLVGSTELTRLLSDDELAAAFATFDDTVCAIVTGRGGRVVKLIGDEVMFTAGDATTACDIAFDLVDALHNHPVLPPLRVALAAGDVILREGDCFGSVVNLAAAVVRIGGPDDVLVSPEVAELASGARYRFTTSGRCRVKGYDEHVQLRLAHRVHDDGAAGA